MPFLPLFTGICHCLAHVFTVPPTKACLLYATPAGMDLYIIQAMPVGTYRVQSPGFPKIVYYPTERHLSQSRCAVVVDFVVVVVALLVLFVGFVVAAVFWPGGCSNTVAILCRIIKTVII